MRTGKLITGCWAVLRPGRRSAGLEPQIQRWGRQEEESGLQDHATDTDGAFLACPAPGKEVAVGRVEAKAEVLRMETAACCVTWAWLPNLSGLQCSDSGLGQQESHVYGGRPRFPASMPLPMPMVSALGSPGVGVGQYKVCVGYHRQAVTNDTVHPKTGAGAFFLIEDKDVSVFNPLLRK